MGSDCIAVGQGTVPVDVEFLTLEPLVGDAISCTDQVTLFHMKLKMNVVRMKGSDHSVGWAFQISFVSLESERCTSSGIGSSGTGCSVDEAVFCLEELEGASLVLEVFEAED
nr:hypothetical protein [Tanacetum cinerariifolium]